MTERDRNLKLANAIERDLCNGFRHFTLAGAELDWVVQALRAYAHGEQMREEKP